MFVGIASVVVLVVVSERLLNFQFFNGNPLLLALFLGVVGGALLYTVRQAGSLASAEDEEEG